MVKSILQRRTKVAATTKKESTDPDIALYLGNDINLDEMSDKSKSKQESEHNLSVHQEESDDSLY